MRISFCTSTLALSWPAINLRTRRLCGRPPFWDRHQARLFKKIKEDPVKFPTKWDWDKITEEGDSRVSTPYSRAVSPMARQRLIAETQHTHVHVFVPATCVCLSQSWRVPACPLPRPAHSQGLDSADADEGSKGENNCRQHAAPPVVRRLREYSIAVPWNYSHASFSEHANTECPLC